ncbi:hypothetical protein [Kineococcus sp. SYSU DK006]|uniref:hypothetical protein n=1 Tax=Kineococcus sp. SYSU DK006 TaxID=3383127 RepID=UPI003D7CE77A
MSITSKLLPAPATLSTTTLGAIPSASTLRTTTLLALLILPVLLSAGCAAPRTSSRCLPAPLQLSPDSIAPGGQVTLSSPPAPCGTTNPGGATYTFMLRYDHMPDPTADPGSDSALVQLGQLQVPADGAFQTQLNIPADAPAGQATLAVTGSRHDEPCEDGGSCAAYSTLLTIT